MSMGKYIFIINGSAGVGKDTFVKCVEEAVNEINSFYHVDNYSSVTRVKEIMEHCGWDSSKKTERDRKFMSDLKLLLTEYNDLPFKDLGYIVEGFRTRPLDKMLFLHIREPEEIARAVKEFNAEAILIKNDSVEHITSNMADENVYNYNYDIIIENNGTLDDLKEVAKDFVNRYYLYGNYNN